MLNHFESILKALPGKLDIKRNSPSIFYFILLFFYVAYTCYFRKYEELKNYSNELQSNIGNLLKIRAVSIGVQAIVMNYRVT